MAILNLLRKSNMNSFKILLFILFLWYLLEIIDELLVIIRDIVYDFVNGTIMLSTSH